MPYSSYIKDFECSSTTAKYILYSYGLIVIGGISYTYLSPFLNY